MCNHLTNMLLFFLHFTIKFTEFILIFVDVFDWLLSFCYGIFQPHLWLHLCNQALYCNAWAPFYLTHPTMAIILVSWSNTDNDYWKNHLLFYHCLFSNHHCATNKRPRWINIIFLLLLLLLLLLSFLDENQISIKSGKKYVFVEK